MMVRNHPSTVALYNDHGEARWAGSIVFCRPRKIIESGPHDGGLADDDRSSVDNRVFATAPWQFLKVFSNPLCAFGNHWARRSQQDRVRGVKTHERVTIVCTVGGRPLINHSVGLFGRPRKRN